MSGERLLLVDDHGGFRASAAALLELEGACVVGTASNGEEALASFPALAADAVLIDLFLPGMDGVDLAIALAARADSPPLILISSHDDAASDPHSNRRVLGALTYLDAVR